MPAQPQEVAARSTWLQRHSFAGFVLIAYGFSWTMWGIAIGGGLGVVPFLLGALGPLLAAAVVTRARGESLRGWIRPVWHWRVPLRWWLYALLLPTGLYAAISAVLQVLGWPVDWTLGVDRLPDYALAFVFVLLLGGSVEEPGWRGFALPYLQARLSPVVATLFVGLAWGIWHVPLYGAAGFVVPTVLAFFYTVLWNRTHSLLLCLLLHASFTPAQDHFIVLPRSRGYTDALDTPDWVILATYVVAALVLILVTKGRLGLDEGRSRTPVGDSQRQYR